MPEVPMAPQTTGQDWIPLSHNPPPPPLLVISLFRPVGVGGLRCGPACGCALAAAARWLNCGRCTSEVPPSLGLVAPRLQGYARRGTRERRTGLACSCRCRGVEMRSIEPQSTFCSCCCCCCVAFFARWCRIQRMCQHAQTSHLRRSGPESTSANMHDVRTDSGTRARLAGGPRGPDQPSAPGVFPTKKRRINLYLKRSVCHCQDPSPSTWYNNHESIITKTIHH
jgi:hypothetical protein